VANRFGGNHLSKDGLHVAQIAQLGSGLAVYRDGQPGASYDDIGGLAWSADSQHLAYAAKTGEKWCMVLDGKEGAPYDGFGEAWDYVPQYFPKTKYVGYKLGERDPSGMIWLSADGKHLAYAAKIGPQSVVVADGREGDKYDVIGELQMSADGQHVAYLAKKGGRQVAVVDGKEGPAYDGVGPLVLSAKGRAAYVAFDGGKYFVVADGKEGARYDFIGLGELQISADNQHVLYTALKDHRTIRGGALKTVAVVDGQEGPEYDGISSLKAEAGHISYVGRTVFARAADDIEYLVIDGKIGPPNDPVHVLLTSPDGKSVVSILKKDRKDTMIVNGKEDPTFDAISSEPSAKPVFSPDSRHFAYVGRTGGPGEDFHGHPIMNDLETGNSTVVLDGKVGPPYRYIENLIFSPDSQHLAYVVWKSGTSRAVVLDGKEGAEYGYVYPPVFSADGRHLAYLVWNNGVSFMVLDGQKGPEYESFAGEKLSLHPDGSFTYLGVRDGVLYRVTQPLPAN
jgi:Tol biopolymer transport system component